MPPRFCPVLLGGILFVAADPNPPVCYDVSKSRGSILEARCVEPLEIMDSLYDVGNTKVSAHLLKTTAGLVLIDSTMPHQTAWPLVSIRKLGFQPSDVKVAIGTHAAVDHTDNHWYLPLYFGAKLWLHVLDAVDAEKAGANPFVDPQGWTTFLERRSSFGSGSAGRFNRRPPTP